jgi:NADH-quinone oxidoreductase subunit N
VSWRDFLLPDLTWQSLTPELVVLLFALLAPLVGARTVDRRGMRQFALIGLGGAFLLSLGSFLQWNWAIPGTTTRFTLEYIDGCAAQVTVGAAGMCDLYAITEASQLFKVLFTAVAFVAVVGIGRPLQEKAERDWGEFYSLLLFATLGMMVVASARELIILILGIELASMSSYLMAAFNRDRRGAEAGLKYFVIGAISSGMSLFAVSLVYAATGTTRLSGIAQALAGGGYDVILVSAIVLFLGGLGFKISMVPFHAWAPDVYSGAPAPVAGVLAAASKAMGFAAMFSVFLVALGGVKAEWELAVALLAAASMTVGNLVAIQQTSVTRMLAWSSIAQAGYLLIAIAVGTWFAVGSGILHLMVNAAMKLGAFVIVGALITVGIPDTIAGYRGLGRKAPLLALAMTIFLLSMAGLPPLGGFASKFFLFSSAVDVAVVESLGWLAWLAVLAVVNSAISLFYYVRLMRAMYIERDDDEARLLLPGGVRTAVTVCAVVVVLVGVWPQPFLDAAMAAARSLLTVGP